MALLHFHVIIGLITRSMNEMKLQYYKFIIQVTEGIYGKYSLNEIYITLDGTLGYIFIISGLTSLIIPASP